MTWVCDFCGYRAGKAEEADQHQSAGCIPPELEEEWASMSRHERADAWTELHFYPPTRDVPIRDGLL